MAGSLCSEYLCGSVDKALFAFDLPQGFAIDTRDSAAAKKGDSESYGFGQEVKPKAKQE